MDVSRDWSVCCGRAGLWCRLSSLLHRAVAAVRRVLSRTRRHRAVSAMSWCAKLSFRALDAMVEGDLEVWWPLRRLWLGKPLVGRSLRWWLIHLDSAESWADMNSTRAGWSGHANHVGVVAFPATINSVARREECVKSLD